MWKYAAANAPTVNWPRLHGDNTRRLLQPTPCFDTRSVHGNKRHPGTFRATGYEFVLGSGSTALLILKWSISLRSLLLFSLTDVSRHRSCDECHGIVADYFANCLKPFFLRRKMWMFSLSSMWSEPSVIPLTFFLKIRTKSSLWRMDNGQD